MADSQKETRLWQPDHNETSQTNIMDHEELQALLIKNVSMLAENMELSEDFWQLLLMGEVLKKETMDYIKVRKTKQAQSLSIMNHLMDGKVYQMHAFFWALVNSGQYALVKQLDLPINDYLDVDIFMKSSTFRCPGCHEAYTIAYLLTGCGHYVCRPCVKGSKFTKTVDGKEEITCPIADCGEITVASPSEENIGLDEDEAFTSLCKMVDSTQAVAELPIQEKEALEEGMEVDEQEKDTQDESMKVNAQEKEIQEQAMKVKAEIEKKLSRLENHKDTLIKQCEVIEEWFQTNMDKYTSVKSQLVKVIQQSVHWMKVVDDLSVLLTARPELKHGLKLPQLSLSSDSIKLTNELMSGCSVEELSTQLEKIPVKLHPTPPFDSATLRCKWRPEGGESVMYEVFWTSNGHIMVAMEKSWSKLSMDDTETQITTAILSLPVGDWLGKDDTWTRCHNRVVEIGKLGEHNVERWRPAHTPHPCMAVVGTDNSYVIEQDTNILRKYNKNRDFIVEQHLEELTTREPFYPQMDICESGSLLIWDYNSVDFYIVRSLDQVVKCQTSQCQIRPPIQVCEGPDEFFLVIDSNGRLCVFTSDGEFLYHVDISEDIGGQLQSASLLTRTGHPALLALASISLNEIHIYALE